jgi:hypothetical protein
LPLFGRKKVVIFCEEPVIGIVALDLRDIGLQALTVQLIYGQIPNQALDDIEGQFRGIVSCFVIFAFRVQLLRDVVTDQFVDVGQG